MKAIWYERIGPAAEVLQVGETEQPAPGPGEVLVRVRASGVNPSDAKTRGGARGPLVFPRQIPHSDGAGVIEAVGDGVATSRVGERVWLWNAAWRRPMGSAAEFVALPAAQAAPLPVGVSFEQGACLGIPAMTAHACLLGAGPVAGETVLVQGGAGAVGRYAVQMARLSGARVLATAGSPERLESARRAGADEVFGYRDPDLADRIREATGGAGVDRIVEVEFGANLAVTQAVAKPFATVAAYASAAVPEPTLPFYPLMFKNLTLRLVFVYTISEPMRAAALRDIGAWLEAGALDHDVAATFPLSEAVAAHEFLERGERPGAVVLTL